MQLLLGIICLALVVMVIRAILTKATGPVRRIVATEAGATLISLAATAMFGFGVALSVAGIVALGG